MEAEQIQDEGVLVPVKELPALKQVSIKVEFLTQLANDYRNLVVTEHNLKEADEARLKLFRPRRDIELIEEGNNDQLNAWKKKNKSLSENLVKIIKPVEDRIKADIAKVKDAIAKREANRKAAHQKNISDMRNVMGRFATMEDKELIQRQIEGFRGLLGKYEEFEKEAKEVFEQMENTGNLRIENLELKAKMAKEQPESEAPDPQPEEPVRTTTSRSKIVETGTITVMPTESPNVQQHSRGEYHSRFEYGGYAFGLPQVDEKTLEHIKQCIREAIDNMEF